MALTSEQVVALRAAGAEIADAALANETDDEQADPTSACDYESAIEVALLAALACGAQMDDDGGWAEVRLGYANRIAEKREVACECGSITLEPCSLEIPHGALVLVEYIPDYQRGTQRAAGYRGVRSVPRGGRSIARCHPECAEFAVADVGDWAQIAARQ